ncbi:holin family protein [Tropicimonas aquimaris]|uniref:Holin family protein n=1 Tax=Tropicimonas aquimaris TaxID=914152 RepID=A0ABW3IM64_9RHOB
MGVMSALMGTLFGDGRNAVAETVELFRENAENGAVREAALSQAALAQFAAEFAGTRRSPFDAVIDGLNRLPRPALALGTLALFVSAMVDPVWFASRMQGIALVPEPLWWLLGGIVGFYFGARHQAKGQEFQRSIATTLAQAGQVTEGLAALEALRGGALARPAALPAPVFEPDDDEEAATEAPNAALAEWKNARG